MATVYLARLKASAGFERLSALKVCHPHLRSQGHFASMFLDEARLGAMIHHPNVVATLDVIDADGVLGIAMEFIEGGSAAALADAARAAGAKLSTPVVLRIALDALAGLQAAHELVDADGKPLGLVHRDVSPQNLLVGYDGLTRLGDLGIVDASTRSTFTRPGEVKGKLGYLAPELLSGKRASVASDLYACGVVLWELLQGERLFDGPDAKLIDQVLRNAVRPLEAVEPGERALLEPLLRRAMARVPDRRFTTAAELAEHLERSGLAVASQREVAHEVRRLLPATPRQAPAPDRATRSERPPPKGRPRRWALALTGALALVLALALAPRLQAGLAPPPEVQAALIPPDAGAPLETAAATPEEEEEEADVVPARPLPPARSKKAGKRCRTCSKASAQASTAPADRGVAQPAPLAPAPVASEEARRGTVWSPETP
ncbi:MAG: serine/threonine protein kinase [Archangiaceae bacterium]|nr:serine/threonine protein kinase [Archangiaceae bacterium]